MEQGAAKVGPPGPHVMESDVGGEVSLYDARGREAVVLNGTASDIWRLADGTSTLDQMVELLARAYGLEPDAIRGDVEATVATFHDRGLLAGKDGG